MVDMLTASVRSLERRGYKVELSLKKPITTEQQAKFEKAFGRRVPPSLLALWKKSNGFVLQWSKDVEQHAIALRGSIKLISAWREQRRVWSKADVTPNARQRADEIAPLFVLLDDSLLGLDCTKPTRSGELPVVEWHYPHGPRALKTRALSVKDYLSEVIANNKAVPLER